MQLRQQHVGYMQTDKKNEIATRAFLISILYLHVEIFTINFEHNCISGCYFFKINIR